MQATFLLTYLVPLAGLCAIAFVLVWFFYRTLLVHFLIFCLFTCVYILSNLSNISSHSLYNHYPLLADALLHGRTYLDFTPGFHDIVTYAGKVYIDQPPIPAVMMMPFVLAYGREFNDILFTIVFGAINCALVYELVLRLNNDAKGFSFGRPFAFFITLMFGLGTVTWYVTARGTVWHTANIITLFFLLIAVVEALGKRRYLIMGIFAALAMFTRPSVLWALPFFVVLCIHDNFFTKKYREFLVKMTFLAIPYIAAGLLIGAWNAMRFGNPFDFGFAYMNHAAHLKANLDTYGTLNLFYLPANFEIAFLNFFRITKIFPYLIPPPDGMAIVFTSPFFLYLFAPLVSFARKRLSMPAQAIHHDRTIVAGSILAIVCTAIPLLLYFNTGWVQFGYRYLLDYIPFMLILLAYCMRGKITWLGIALFAIAFVVNLYGMIMYIHFETPIMNGAFG
jgi:hypothetical protein